MHRLVSTALITALGTTFGAALGVGAAHAADPFPVAAPAQAADWSGFYAGIHGGYGFGEVDVTDGTIGGATAIGTGGDLEGFVGGIQIGADVQRGSLVFGAAISASLTEMEYHGAVVVAPPTTPVTPPVTPPSSRPRWFRP